MWSYIALALLADVLVMLINSFRYKIILSAADQRISHKKTLLINLGVKFSTYVTPFKTGAAITKPIITNKMAAIPIKFSAPLILFEQFFDIGWQIVALPFLLILIGEAAMISSFTTEFIIIALSVVFIGIAYIKRSYIFSKIWSMKRLLPARFHGAGKKMGINKPKMKQIIKQSSVHISNRKFLAKISFMTLLTVFVAPLTIYYCGLAFSVGMTYPTAFLLYWASMIIGRFSGIPGGFGAREFSLVAMLGALGIPLAAATGFSVIYRIVMMLIPIGVGGPVFFYASGKIARAALFRKNVNEKTM